MKKFIFLIGLIFLFNVFCGNLYSDIDLVKLQKQEKARRKNTPPSRFVVNNYNVGTIGGKKYSLCQVKVYPEVIYKERIKPKDPKKTFEYWQRLKNELESQIEKVESKIEKEQLELNKVFSDWLIMDLPYEKDKLRDQILKLKASLNKDKIKLKRLLKAFENLFERARKASVPLGWLR